MNHTPEQQWSALSALYEEADALPADVRPAWLARLEAAQHPLLPQLKRMLEAREQLETGEFLGTLPKLSAVAAATTQWSSGSRVGSYRLVRPLGEGGMAEVWLAERDDGAFKRQVAIKLPYPRSGRESFAARFDRERDILATLRHPHIAGLFDAGVTKEGQAWLALEYVEGQAISQFCDERRLALRERVNLFRQVLLAVQHAHANLVIHRDLKPANILVTPQGEVRLLDFGIAKLLEAEGDAIAETELTRQVGRSLTPRYASPEQLTGMPLTTACDVYSLGVVFYELMSGERPYELKVESAAQLEHAILEVEPRAPSRRNLSVEAASARSTNVKGLRGALHPELDAIALRCLEKKPSGRYSSVDAVLADVDRWLTGEAVLARAPGAWYRFGKFAARHRIGVGLSMGGVVSLAVVAAAAMMFAMQAKEESARAMAARDFMLSLFKRADQEKSRGADITARELLETGRKDVLTRMAGQPRLQAELLEGIATIQKDMGEFVNAEDTFAEVARIYTELRLTRQAILARAAQASNALEMGNTDLAQSLLEQAMEMPGRPRTDAEVNSRLTEVEGWIASIRGDAQKARTLFADSLRQATMAFGRDHEKTTGALLGSVYAERQLRNFDGALTLQDRLEAIKAKTTDRRSKEFISLEVDHGELLYVAGRYAETLAYVQKALARCAQSLGPNDEYCRRLLFTRVRVLVRLGFLETARADLPTLNDLSTNWLSPSTQMEALLLSYRLEVGHEPEARLQFLFDRVRSFAQSGDDVHINPQLKAKALLALAEAELLTGRPIQAQRWIEDGLAMLKSSDVRSGTLPAVASALMGVALLNCQQTDKALEWTLRSQRELGEALGKQHALTQIFSLNLALGLEAAGRISEALAVVRTAEPTLRLYLGSQAPTYLRVQQLQSRLETSLAGERHAKSYGKSKLDPETRVAGRLDFFS